MSIHNREQEYIRILAGQKRSVKDLSERLSISEPTVRRDILAMKEKGLIECKRGMVSLIANSPDARIPLNVRDYENTEKKIIIAQRIASVQDADKIIIMDGGTISAIGTHEQLLRDNEIYQELYTSQNKGGDNNG